MIILKAHQLQRLAEILLRLEALLEREGGDARELEEGLEELAARVGVHLEVLRLMEGKTLLRTLAPGDRPDPGRIWVVAEILFLDGIRALAAAEATDPSEDAANLLRRAALLYRTLEEWEGTLDLPVQITPGERAEQIRSLLSPLSDHPSR